MVQMDLKDLKWLLMQSNICIQENQLEELLFPYNLLHLNRYKLNRSFSLDFRVKRDVNLTYTFRLYFD